MGGARPGTAPAGAVKKSHKDWRPKNAAEKAADVAETWLRIQTDPRPFDPKLGDQAVKLLDKAITTFRERRAAVMQQLDDDVQTIKWSNKDIKWIDQKVKELTEHKSQCSQRLKEVTEALRKFGATPDEENAGHPELGAEVEDTRRRSVMPLMGVAAAGTKHSSLSKVRCDLKYGESYLEMERGFDMTTKYRPRKTKEELIRASSAPGTTRYELKEAVKRLPPV